MICWYVGFRVCHVEAGQWRYKNQHAGTKDAGKNLCNFTAICYDNNRKRSISNGAMWEISMIHRFLRFVAM